ncbi:hypothetical protein MRX96_034054 [Rhipicephalus microplus]
MGFHIERDTVKFANYKVAETITSALGPGGCATTLSSNTLVFAVQILTAALCHVLLPLLQTVCIVVPIKYAPSSYHYSNKIAVPLDLVSPKERISTSYYWMLQPSWDSASKGTLSSSPIIKEQRPTRPLCELGVCATTLSSKTLVFAVQMITAALCHVLLPSCADGIHRGANKAYTNILPLPK